MFDLSMAGAFFVTLEVMGLFNRFFAKRTERIESTYHFQVRDPDRILLHKSWPKPDNFNHEYASLKLMTSEESLPLSSPMEKLFSFSHPIRYWEDRVRTIESRGDTWYGRVEGLVTLLSLIDAYLTLFASSMHYHDYSWIALRMEHETHALSNLLDRLVDYDFGYQGIVDFFKTFAKKGGSENYRAQVEQLFQTIEGTFGWLVFIGIMTEGSVLQTRTPGASITRADIAAVEPAMQRNVEFLCEMAEFYYKHRSLWNDFKHGFRVADYDVSMLQEFFEEITRHDKQRAHQLISEIEQNPCAFSEEFDFWRLHADAKAASGQRNDYPFFGLSLVTINYEITLRLCKVLVTMLVWLTQSEETVNPFSSKSQLHLTKGFVTLLNKIPVFDEFKDVQVAPPHHIISILDSQGKNLSFSDVMQEKLIFSLQQE